jgi:hypothetical protein
MVIKLFEIDTSVREVARQVGLAYNTVYNIHSLIRRAILATDTNPASFSGEAVMDESYFGGEGGRGNVVVEPQARSRSSGSWRGAAR